MENEDQNYGQQDWQSGGQNGWQPAGGGSNYENYVPEPEEGPGFAIAGMVCGILSIVCCCVWYVGLVLGIVGLVLSIISVRQHRPGKGMAIAGIICSSIGLGIGLLMGITSIITMLNPSYQNEILREFYQSYGDYMD